MLIAAGFLGLGLVFGFVSLALGPLGLVEALIVLGLVAIGMRRRPERTGAYLVGMSILPVVILTAIVTRLPACGAHAISSRCYASITLPALILYGVAGLLGAVICGLTLRRAYQGSATASQGPRGSRVK